MMLQEDWGRSSASEVDGPRGALPPEVHHPVRRVELRRSLLGDHDTRQDSTLIILYSVGMVIVLAFRWFECLFANCLEN